MTELRLGLRAVFSHKVDGATQQVSVCDRFGDTRFVLRVMLIWSG
jgi:hypothetical protein